MKIIYIDKFGIPGTVSWLSDAYTENVGLPTGTDGAFYVEYTGTVGDEDLLNNYVYVNNNWHQRPSGLSRNYSFNDSSSSWYDIRTLEQVKTTQWNLLKTSRDTSLTSPLTTTYGVFDADYIGQKNITDAIALLQVLESQGTPQTIDFTLYDNSVVTLTTAEMVQVGIALGIRTQGVYAVSRDLRDQINNSTTIPEVESITWPV